MTQSMATKKWQPRVQTGRAVKFEVATSFEGACIFLLKPNTFLLNLGPGITGMGLSSHCLRLLHSHFYPCVTISALLSHV